MRQADQDLVQRYFDDELAPDERARFEAEMSEDDQLRLAALAEMRALLVATLDAEAANVDIWSGVAAQLAGGQQKKQTVRRWRDRVRGRSFQAGAGFLMAALATLLFFVQPWHGHNSENDCDVESLEVDGAMATVFKVHDVPHNGGSDTTTIIWSEED